VSRPGFLTAPLCCIKYIIEYSICQEVFYKKNKKKFYINGSGRIKTECPPQKDTQKVSTGPGVSKLGSPGPLANRAKATLF
jgi:hypothetical protein